MTHRRTGAADRIAHALAAGWLLVMLVPVHNLVQRPNSQAVSQIGLEPVLELAYFGVVGVIALAVIRTLEPDLDQARPPGALALLPAWICVTAAWSDSGPYAFIRGAEMGVVVALAWATIALGRLDPSLAADVARRVLRWFVVATAALCTSGLLFGNVLVPASDQNLQRFAWVGAHPNGAGVVLAIAILIVATAPAGVLRLSAGARWLLASGFLVLLWQNESRTSWASLLAGAAVAATIAAVRHERVRRLAPLAVGALPASVVVLWTPLATYFSRGQQAGSLATGNGRLTLWPIGLDALQSPFDWLFGLGYGAARTVFVAEVSWAKTAHNSVLALLVSGGIVAVALLVLLIGGVVRSMRRTHLASTSRFGYVLPAVLTALCVNGLASDVLAEPNIGFAGVCFVGAIVGSIDPRDRAEPRHEASVRSR